MASKDNLLFAVSEYDGIVKTGGLADVSAALAPRMKKLGHDVRVFLPAYSTALKKMETTLVATGGAGINGHETLWFGIRHAVVNGVDIYFIEYNEFFARDELYSSYGEGYYDNSLRFAFFCKAVLEAARILKFKPDVIHCHDWQTALIPYYLKTSERDNPFFKQTGTVLTIHNGAYQQQTSCEWLEKMDIRQNDFHSACFEDHGMINLLKGGIAYADKVTTVSPGYAGELLTELGSHGLYDAYRRRENDLVGILNGCDYDQWNPETDLLIPEKFSRNDRTGKQVCKAHLQQRMELPGKPDVPVFGLVSRLAEQKGFSYLIPALWRFLQEDVQVVLLGSGDVETGNQLNELARYFPHKCSFYQGFDNSLAHEIEAGSDFFLMPSLFEPCGLNQIYSMKYGTLPIVRGVGGLKDTVRDYSEYSDKATGFVFDGPCPDELYNCLMKSLLVYRRQDSFSQLVGNAMAQDFSWEKPVERYLDTYRSAKRQQVN